MSRAVATEIRQEILAGKLKPGERLRQNQLAARFATSSTPIREALTILSAQGLVQIDDRRGASVFEPTLAELAENHMIRESLEALATKEAVPNLTDTDREKLQSTCEAMCETDDTDVWLELNSVFHITIYRAAGLPVLLDLILRMRDVAFPYLNLLVRSDYLADRGDTEHRLILQAVLDGDIEQAVEHTRSHIRSTVGELGKVLEHRRTGP